MIIDNLMRCVLHFSFKFERKMSIIVIKFKFKLKFKKKKLKKKKIGQKVMSIELTFIVQVKS